MTGWTRISIALLALLGLASGAAARGGGGAQRGPYKVGVTTLTFTKTAVGSGAPRPLATVIWYPAAGRTGTEEALGRRDATVRRGRFPLIIFSHGACGRPIEASYLTVALASYGFVVAAPPHPGHTADDFPDCLNAVVDAFLNRLPDVRFTIDSMLAEAANPSSRFAHRLRTEVIGMSGLSFGGFDTLLAAQQEPRLLAALALVPGGTGVLGATDITIPTMVIGAERDKVVGFAESQKAYERLAGPRFLVELLGGNHLSAVDDCFNQELDHSFCVAEDITQDAAHRLVLRYAVPFFRRYLEKKRNAAHMLVRSVDGITLQAQPKR